MKKDHREPTAILNFHLSLANRAFEMSNSDLNPTLGVSQVLPFDPVFAFFTSYLALKNENKHFMDFLQSFLGGAHHREKIRRDRG